jgi:hypothetical protein
MTLTASVLAATLLNAGGGGVELSIDGESDAVDPAQSVFLTVTVKAPKGVSVEPPDIRGRVRGFSLAESFAKDPETLKDGSTVKSADWRLVPEPCAKAYKIAPFAVEPSGAPGFVAGPLYFKAPPPREPVTGGMEVNPKKDLPPFSWRLVGKIAAWAALAAAALFGLFLLVRHLARRVKEHMMSPIERAWAELDRLLKRRLPGKGRYKDFYVELTMVVRRYVQRKYGVKAPHMTTEEFLGELRRDGGGRFGDTEALGRFLESADMVKFAGVEATTEMADDATASARDYLESDNGGGRRQGAEKGGAS